MPSTGDVFCGTGENVASGGGFAWSNPDNITADDAADAGCTAVSALSDYLVARNFDFSGVPDGQIITGITVKIECSEHSAGTQELLAQLQDDSSALIGEVKSSLVSGTTKVVHTYGGSTDDWTVELTSAIVKDADFGVRIWFGPDTHSFNVDYVTMALEYEPAPNPRRPMWFLAGGS